MIFISISGSFGADGGDSESIRIDEVDSSLVSRTRTRFAPIASVSFVLFDMVFVTLPFGMSAVAGIVGRVSGDEELVGCFVVPIILEIVSRCVLFGGLFN